MEIIKNKPIRLKGKAKIKLNSAVLKRDGHTCQNPYCIDGWPLDIPHHVTKKSQLGSDIESNLTTLCIFCHAKVHHTGELKVTGEYPNFKFEVVYEKANSRR